jgi:nucleotide sugar dehydrogenase
MAEVGFDVFGVEVREDVVEVLQRGEPHFFEPGMASRLARTLADGRLRVSQHIPEDNPATVYVITVGTPLDADGRVRLDMIEHVCNEVAAVLHDGDLVIMRSTVKLGTTRQVVRPILESTGKTFDLAFCPERTLEGQAMEELRYLPQIVGGDSYAANVRAGQLFAFVTPTVVRVSDIETAEIVKLIDNAQRDVIFGYANEVAAVCDAAGVSAREVISAGKLGYPRTNLPMPGPVGGPCLSKDSYILAQSLEPLGLEPALTLTARRLNERQPTEVADFLRRTTASMPGFPEDPVVALLGLAFKGRPATDDLRGTMARPIFNALKRLFPSSTFRGYDPEVAALKIAEFGLAPMPSLGDAMRDAHLVVVMNNHPELTGMPLEILASGMATPGLVYDFWNAFDARDLRLPDGIGYAALGSHAQASVPGKR